MTFQGGPPDSGGPVYIPDPLAVRELNFGDEWRARWVEGEPLPSGVPVEYVYAAVLFEGKGYVCRPKGSDRWDTLEGKPEDGKPESFIRQGCRARIGAEVRISQLVGFLDCKATSHHPTLEAGAAAVIPFYTVGARRVGTNPKDAEFERRRLPLNEYGVALRQRYPEFVRFFPRVVERYLVLQTQGEAV